MSHQTMLPRLVLLVSASASLASPGGRIPMNCGCLSSHALRNGGLSMESYGQICERVDKIDDICIVYM